MVQVIGLMVGVYVLMRCIEIFCFNPSRYKTKGALSLIRLVAIGTLTTTAILVGILLIIPET